MQLQQRAYQDQIRQLNIQIARLSKPKPRRTRRSDNADNAPATAEEPPHPLSPLKPVIRGAGRKYALLHRPWPPSASEVFPLVPHVEGVDPYNSSTHYPSIGYSQDAKAAALKRALAAELASVIPATILPHLENAYVVSQVCS